MELRINGEAKTVEVESNMPLLWVLRDELNMTGTKYGCGVSSCGSCTVLIDGVATRTCTYPVAAAVGKDIKTIEALAVEGKLSEVQQAWIDHQVPQCGYCQSGMIMAVEGLLSTTPNPTDEEIDDSITNICRCGTYPRIRRAIHSVAAKRNEVIETVDSTETQNS